MSSVDVVVPCYNYGRYLKDCVESVLTQRDADFRVLVIDDASSDETCVVAGQLAAADPRVSYIRNEMNLGLVGTANRGIMEWARAHYTLLLSADDALTPGSLARSMHVLDANPSVGMVYGMAEIFEKSKPSAELTDAIIPTFQIIAGWRLLKFCCEVGNPIASPTAIVRTKFLQSTGGYCAKLPHTSDMEMWMRIAMHHSVAIIKDTQAYYRWHNSNMTSLHCSGWLGDLPERVSTCEYVHSKSGGERNPGFGQWLEQMKRSAAKHAIRRATYLIDTNDWSNYRNCISFATKMNPYWVTSPSSWRLHVKRLIGPALYHAIRRAVQRGTMGGRYARGDGVAELRLFGWWPEPSA
jgi:glycosyltransferase involved in cell wall biosynthesis